MTRRSHLLSIPSQRITRDMGDSHWQKLVWYPCLVTAIFSVLFLFLSTDLRSVLITFPLKGSGQSKLLTNLYNESHAGAKDTTNWIQLGSTLIYKDQKWTDYKSSYDKTDERAIAEDELLSLFSTRACILNLAGLYGGQRQLRHWLPRVARSKEQAAAKGAVHMVHGNDVSRAILGAHFSLLKEASADQALESPKPQTVGGWHWPITDLHCYDWWDLFMQFGSYARENAIAGGVSEAILKGANPESLTYEKWVLELMDEQGVKALPRDKERNGMGRLVDGRAFWDVVGSWPEEGRADRRE